MVGGELFTRHGVVRVFGSGGGRAGYAWGNHCLILAPLLIAVVAVGHAYGFWGDGPYLVFKKLRAEYPAVTAVARFAGRHASLMLGSVYIAILGVAVYKKDAAGIGFSLRCAFGMVVFAVLLTKLLKAGFGMPRPGHALPPMPFSFLRSYSSFPSGHTVCVVALAVPLAVRAGRRSLCLLTGLLVAAVGVSRVWLGAHHPVDILAGAAVGSLAAWYTAQPRAAPGSARSGAGLCSGGAGDPPVREKVETSGDEKIAA